ncbi:MAG: hypothetical protein RIF33_17530 [Cyclobacteriaceae bacterium]
MKKLALILILFFSIDAYAGGGWSQPKGKGFLKLSQSAIIAGSYFSPSGDILDITTTSLYSSSVFLEYGLTDRLTGIVYMPFFVRSTLNKLETPDGNLVQDGDELNSIGDADVTIKYGLIQNSTYVLSASLTLGLPLGEASGGETQLLQSGDGEFNQMLTLELSRGFSSGWYATVLAGFNNRTNNFSDEIRYGGEVGYSKGKVIPILKVYGVASLMNGDDLGVPNNGVFSNNIEYLSITPEVLYDVNGNFGVTAAIGLAAFAKRLLAAPNFMAGVYWNL